MSATIRDPAPFIGWSTLRRVDYADAFAVSRAAHPGRTATDWAKAILEGDPAMRDRLRRGWSMIGLRSDSGDAIAGWAVRESEDDRVLLGRSSRIGMPGQLLVIRRPDHLVVVTVIRFDFAPTRLVWRAVAKAHLRIVPALLDRAAA